MWRETRKDGLCTLFDFVGGLFYGEGTYKSLSTRALISPCDALCDGWLAFL
jgi:hypothetical protein